MKSLDRRRSRPHFLCYLFLSISILSSCTSIPEEMVLLPADPVRLAIHEGNEAAIPGSKGQIKIHLGDITGGQVMLSVTKADEEQLVDPYSVRPGEVIQVQLGDEELYIKVVKLHNFLLGDDFGEFEVSKSPLEPGISSSQDSQQGAPVDADKPKH